MALIVTLPFTVHATKLTELLATTTPEAAIIASDRVEDAAHAVSLLSATYNPDPLGARGGGDVLVKDGALVSQGPVGEDLIESSKTKNGEISIYVVREGDSLSQIAEMYGVTTNTILWANDIAKATSIQPGDTLVILPIIGVQYEIKSGDTITGIAEKFGGDAEEILEYNQLASLDEIAVGDTIVIPGGQMHSAAPQSSGSSRPAPVKVTGNAAAASALAHPLPGSIRTQGIHGYNAVDLAAGAGTPIRAAAAGEVIVSKSGGWNGGYGNYIVIRHANGVQTLYAHNSSNAVGVGAWVGQGETIGYVGSTGRSTGAHLHFEVRGGANPF